MYNYEKCLVSCSAAEDLGNLKVIAFDKTLNLKAWKGPITPPPTSMNLNSLELSAPESKMTGKKNPAFFSQGPT